MIDAETNDRMLELLWNQLGDIPVDEDGNIDQKYHITYLGESTTWEVGADREEIWHWFDEHHSVGVAKLMNLK